MAPRLCLPRLRRAVPVQDLAVLGRGDAALAPLEMRALNLAVPAAVQHLRLPRRSVMEHEIHDWLRVELPERAKALSCALIRLADPKRSLLSHSKVRPLRKVCEPNARVPRWGEEREVPSVARLVNGQDRRVECLRDVAGSECCAESGARAGKVRVLDREVGEGNRVRVEVPRGRDLGKRRRDREASVVCGRRQARVIL